MSKEDASMATAVIKSVLLSCVIDAKESRRNVATVDISCTFMQDELVHNDTGRKDGLTTGEDRTQ